MDCSARGGGSWWANIGHNQGEPPLARIRAVIVTVPAMLNDLIASLARTRIDMVAELGDRDGLLANLQRLRPDLVVIGLGATESDAAVRASQQGLPATKFLALSADGRSVVGYRAAMIASTSPMHRPRPWSISCADPRRGRSSRAVRIWARAPFLCFIDIADSSGSAPPECLSPDELRTAAPRSCLVGDAA
jgi:hypothetical protein